MNRHQVLTGACNSGENCYAVGSVEGIHFTAYAAGCNIVILAGNFERVQIIPGVAHGNIKVTCIDCSTDTGKIAASYGKKVYVFEPTPIAVDSTHGTAAKKLDYRWYKTAEIETECYINSLSWNMEGSKLLTGGDLIQIWQFIPKNRYPEGEEGGSRRVHFHLGGDPGNNADTDEDALNQRISHAIDPLHFDIVHDPGMWDCVWKCKPATPVYHLQFSPDGFLFASAGKADRLVKIWYEDLKVQHGLVRMDSLSPRKDVLHYSFIYIAHPRAVTGFTWRKTSKYMPRGAVANMLVTSCMDNVSRIWVETILPDDGLVDFDQFDPSVSHDPKHHTQRHKKRFVQRLKTIRHAIHKRRKPKYGPETVMSSMNLSSMSSVHDFHRFAIHHNGLSPVLHFHLAGSINPETDLPLLPLAGNPDTAHNFRLHWLDNKELQFTMEAEKLLQELHSKLEDEDSLMDPGGGAALGAAGGAGAEEEGSEEDVEGDHDYEEATTKEEHGKKKKQKKSGHKKGKGDKLGQHAESQASLASDEGNGATDVSPSLLECLDRNIEMLLKDWQSSSDMLFSIHPVDGSFLVWLVEWLDEYSSVSFRQAQVSFSSRLPKAFPIMDASTMACNLLLYCNYSRMDIKSAMRISEGEMLAGGGVSHRGPSPSAPVGGVIPDNMLIPNVLLVSKHNNGSLNQWQVSFTETSKFQTVVSVAHAARVCGHRFRANAAACHPVLPLLLTTSHHNLPDPTASPERETTPEENEDNKNRTAAAGSFAFCSELILWQVGHVGPLSKSGGLIELARINSPDISAFTSIAWVPTLLPSTSLGSYSYSPSALFVASDGPNLRLYQAVIDARLLLTESKSSRANDFGTSFSSTSSSYVPEPNSPKGGNIDMFNLVSLQSSARPGCLLELDSINDATADWQNIQLLHVFQEPLVVDYKSHNHSRSAFGAPGFGDTMSAYVDLSSMSNFEENFYLVVLERLSSTMGDEGSRLHMWKITTSSESTQASTHSEYTKGLNGHAADGDHTSLHNYDSDEEAAMMFQASQNLQKPSTPAMRMSITTVKVCTQTLALPTGVSVISANVAAGHLSSASIYPACFAPYLIATACSDGQVRLWKCSVQDMEPQMRHDNSFNITSYDFSLGSVGPGVRPAVTSSQVWKPQEHDYWWGEWQMMCSSNRSSAVSVPGKPITVSCAYSGRMAVAYRRGNVQVQPNHPEEKFINLYVAIYECESTGGSEWVLEDTIELENIKIPDPLAEIELNQVLSAQIPLPPGLSIHTDPFEGIPNLASCFSSASMSRTKSVPSLSTLQSVRKSITEQGNKLGLLKQKCLVQLDWVSTEDGSHILTVGVGTKILAYCQVSSEVAQASIKANTAIGGGVRDVTKKADVFVHRPKALLQKSKSLAVDDYEEEIRWMRLRVIELETADGLPPLPMHTSWVRGGILVVGMDNEFHVYTQWRGGTTGAPASSVTAGNADSHMGEELTTDKRTLTEANLASMASSAAMTKSYKSMSNFKSSLSMPSAKHTQTSTSASKREPWRKPGNSEEKGSLARSDSTTSLSVMHDFGLFEAARLANPVLPQYHPEQLKALLSFGKIRRVKAILAHLLRCIIGTDNMQAVFADGLDSEDGLLRSTRSRSISAPEDDSDGIAAASDDSFEFMEMSSIPPLPIYALMAADADNTGANLEIAGTTEPSNQMQDYTDLFSTYKEETLDLSDDASKLKRHHSSSNNPQLSPYAFTPAHSKVLSKQLMRISVPGLNSLDQMYLVAMADTVAHCKMDFADCFTESKEGSLANDSQVDVNQATESMDDCGLRFVLAMRQHIHLLSTLPLVNRVPLQRQGLKSYSLVWAFHSEANEELLSMIPCMQRDEPNWDELRQFGVGWWLTSNTLLRQVIERVAKCAFQKNKDPMDAAIFYLAMRKKNVLWGLFRSVENKQKADFFKRDFTQDESRRVAKKNAFHLMGKQKFCDSAALFLLSGSLHDAVMVLLDKLNDFQLALVVCRLYEIDDPLPESVRQLLYKHILGMDESGKNCSSHKAHTDPFLRSMALWMLQDYQAALNTLLEDKPGHRESKEDPDSVSTTPNIFSFYNYLRTHPLLLRLRLASTSLKQRRAILTGFTRANSVAVSDKITTIDRVTWRERKLFFATATSHMKNGCPLLALEVMTRLPPTMDSEREQDSDVAHTTAQNEESISTGILSDPSKSSSVTNGTASNKSSEFDWSTPLAGNKSGADRSECLGWEAPVSSQDTADAFDWSAPVTNKVRFDDELELDLKLDSDSEEGEDYKGLEVEGKSRVTFDVADVEEDEDNKKLESDVKKRDLKADIMAQQYKYIACLKVLMEELSTLATGFEVDGGQLRYQLYVWLEKEVEVLKVLCNYGLPEEVASLPEADLDSSQDTDEEAVGGGGRQRTLSQRSDTSRASLHETILADKYDLDFKERRLAKRKRWLKQHQHLLRTLASYCILQGSSGGGLASVHMELLLLLQELQQERAKQQLKSPLPFPTTLPLLSATLASSRTVIADPIQYLQRMSQDLLQSITAFTSPPSSSSSMQQVVSMRSLAVSLSSCIYQCLCDSDSFYVNLARAAEPGQEGFIGSMFVAPNSNLMAGILRQRQRSESSNEERINTAPAKWPGVTSLHCLLLSAKDEDAPKLHVLLCEALMAVYVSLLVNGLAMFETQILYRLLANKLDQQTWGALFGGGCRTALKMEKNIPKLAGDPMSKQRLKFNMKVMGVQKEKAKEGLQKEKDGLIKETYKEKFVAPELSMITYFMTKPFVPSSNSIINYDSDDSMDSGDDVDGDADSDDDEMETVRPNTLNLAGQQEHCDPNSYSWCLMRYAIMRAVLTNLRTFLPQIGIELSELPIVSPMLHAVMRLLERWESMMQARLDLFSGPPDNFIPGLTLEIISGKPISKLEALLNAENTPFVNTAATLPVKRLWFHLLRQENLQDIFLRYVYRRPHRHINSDDESMRTGSSDDPRLQDPMKVVHKEQDIITSFAVNQANESVMALATQNKLLELDVGLLLHPPTWLSDENEYDIEMLKNPINNVTETMPEFLVLHTPQDTPQPPSGSQTPSTPYLPSPAGSVQGLQTGRGTSVTIQRVLQGVRKIGSHPNLQYYLTGSADGCVRLWEWDHRQPVTTLRQPGTFPKVTKVLFNAQGNKCCVSDVEGSICLWQVGLGSNFNKPIMSLSCHNKTTSDFTFVGCSSLIATAGHSSESKNVCLWDTLLPPRSALVHAFPCHEHGSPAVVYAPQSQTLISGGRRGDICQFDLRQRKIKNTFQAHESAVKCLAVDYQEEYYVTGSAEGDIKVWAMNSNQLCFSFPGEHSKNTFFRSVGSTSGVTQVAINNSGHLFSCGADGSIKFRQLPEKEIMMHHFI